MNFLSVCLKVTKMGFRYLQGCSHLFSMTSFSSGDFLFRNSFVSSHSTALSSLRRVVPPAGSRVWVGAWRPPHRPFSSGLLVGLLVFWVSSRVSVSSVLRSFASRSVRFDWRYLLSCSLDTFFDRSVLCSFAGLQSLGRSWLRKALLPVRVFLPFAGSFLGSSQARRC